MDRTRRNFLQGAAIFGAGMLGTRTVAAQEGEQNEHGKMQGPSGGNTDHRVKTQQRLPAERAGFLPVVTPDIPDLPYKMENGVKVFHLIAEPVKRQLVPFKTMEVWGYNGSCPGPTIQANKATASASSLTTISLSPQPFIGTVSKFPIEMDGLVVHHPETDSARRPIRLRIYTASGRDLFLPFTRRHARDDGHDRDVHSASRETLQAASGSRLRNHPARVGHPARQQRSEYSEHGIQLANVQRRFRPCYHTVDRAAWAAACEFAWSI